MTIRILTGDCRDVLPTLEAGSVHCVVCSPPYYALRSYLDASHPDKHREIGSEPTPDAYIQTMVEVFRELRRVLRDDGTVWCNMGDSFSSKQLLMMPARLALALQADGWWLRSDIIWAKPNPMPESVTDRPTSAHEHVFLLTKRSRYYYDADAVREPVSDTPGAASWRRIFDPAKQTKETALKELGIKGGNDGASHHPESGRNLRNVWTIATAPFSAAHFATFPPELAERCIRAGTSERGCCAQCGKPWQRVVERNLDNVPTRLATKRAPVDNAAVGAYLRESRRAAFFTTKQIAMLFPSATGSLTGCVSNWELGLNTPTPEQWTKLKEVLGLDDRFDAQIYGTVEATITDYGSNKAPGVRTGSYAKTWNTETATTGWQPGCQCNAEVAPCVVLDPFSGAGTSGLVADRLGRDAVMIDLNHQYVEMARERLQADCPLFADITDAPVPEPPEDERMADLFTEAAE